MLESYRRNVNFIKKYAKAVNAASGSEVDANANVENKNITTCMGELPKKEIIGTNRLLMHDKITELYGEDMADEYIRQLESHEIYKHDETSIMPYTYSSKEVVNVLYHNHRCLLSMEQLYDLCEEPETLVDESKIVYIKYPLNMFIFDKNGLTQIQRLIKKKKHRDLVRVKTSFGEDLIVTDNHPMIVNDNIDDTVDAINVLGNLQYRSHSCSEFDGQNIIDVKSFCDDIIREDWGDFFTVQLEKNYKTYGSPKSIELNESVGYFVGFFIGDGNYNYCGGNITDYVNITQKDKNTLTKLGSIASEMFKAEVKIIEKKDKSNCYCLRVYSPVLVRLLLNVFKIGHMAQNKTLPINVYEYTESFAKGLVEGLIDSDGTITSNNSFQIRVASRTLILQLSDILRTLGYGVSNTLQDAKFGCNEMIEQKYQIFGVTFSERDTTPSLDISYKAQYSKLHAKGLKYKSDEWVKVTNVEIMENEKFLEANEYIYDITTASHTFICNNILVHNCVSITMYPFLFNGLGNIGGISSAPTNLQSFCGSFINLVFAIAAQFAGAVSTPEFLTYMDYFIRKEYGDDYYKSVNIIALNAPNNKRTLDKFITDAFEQVVYSLNQPAAARNFQSVFWNIAYFDHPYFNSIFNGFVFPDGTEPLWDSVNWLQKRFMKWFNKERLKKPLTFPVETLNLLNDGEDVVDKEWGDFQSEMYAEGHSFFTYTSDSVDSLASCCRLKNGITDNTFSYTLGAGGVSTGSKGVLTINLNRLVQDATNNGIDISKAIEDQVEKCHKYLIAYDAIIHDYFNAHLLSIFDAGYINLDKQYLTIGINGFVEGAEFLGIEISPNEKYFEYGEKILKPIYELNKRDKTKHIMFNTEFVPAENLGVKNAKWDREDGYFVLRDCYNSYFYKVEDETCNVIDKFILHGKKLTQYLDGGSALHCNLDEHLTKDQYRNLLKTAIKEGCSYYTFNIPNTICNECGHISKQHLDHCEKCGSKNVDYLTRIIGYLKRVSKFSEARIKEAGKRYYGKL